MYAVINSSKRVVKVSRLGKLLIVHHWWNSISTCKYDQRFTLLPKTYSPPDYGYYQP